MNKTRRDGRKALHNLIIIIFDLFPAQTPQTSWAVFVIQCLGGEY